MQEIVTILVSTLGTVLTALIAWGMQELILWLRTKVKNEKLARILEMSVNTVANVVKGTYQTYVEAIKGTEKWTEEAQKEALRKSIETAKSLMTEESKKFIAETYGDLDAWLTNIIEAKIYDLKQISVSTEKAFEQANIEDKVGTTAVDTQNTDKKD
ncbi:MAG: phage holin, LLH family [Clostridia bacterium]